MIIMRSLSLMRDIKILEKLVSHSEVSQSVCYLLAVLPATSAFLRLLVTSCFRPNELSTDVSDLCYTGDLLGGIPSCRV